jgi:hypothetical protein
MAVRTAKLIFCELFLPEENSSAEMKTADAQPNSLKKSRISSIVSTPSETDAKQNTKRYSKLPRKRLKAAQHEQPEYRSKTIQKETNNKTV